MLPTKKQNLRIIEHKTLIKPSFDNKMSSRASNPINIDIKANQPKILGYQTRRHDVLMRTFFHFHSSNFTENRKQKNR